MLQTKRQLESEKIKIYEKKHPFIFLVLQTTTSLVFWWEQMFKSLHSPSAPSETRLCMRVVTSRGQQEDSKAASHSERTSTVLIDPVFWNQRNCSGTHSGLSLLSWRVGSTLDQRSTLNLCFRPELWPHSNTRPHLSWDGDSWGKLLSYFHFRFLYFSFEFYSFIILLMLGMGAFCVLSFKL